jgi:hypothetical protein
VAYLAPAVLGVLLLVVPTAADEKKKETDTDFKNLQPLAEAIAKADKVTLYEGLPHQVWEKELLDQELKEKQTVTDHGFPFYAGPLDLKPDDAKKLTALAADAKSFQKWSGYKRCGGFHPDYMVEWRVGKDVYRMHVCFGCHEVKVYGPKAELYCDMSDAGLHGLEAVLKPYRKNRPKAGE